MALNVPAIAAALVGGKPFNLVNLAKSLVGGRVDIDRAVEIINQAIFLMELAEQAAVGLKGNEKLQAVVNGTLGFIRYVLPDETEAFITDVSRKLAPIVSMIVTIYNLRGLWPKAGK